MKRTSARLDGREIIYFDEGDDAVRVLHDLVIAGDGNGFGGPL